VGDTWECEGKFVQSGAGVVPSLKGRGVENLQHVVSHQMPPFGVLVLVSYQDVERSEGNLGGETYTCMAYGSQRHPTVRGTQIRRGLIIA